MGTDYSEPRPLPEESGRPEQLNNSDGLTSVSGMVSYVSVFPNPTTGELTVDYRNELEEEANIELRDLLGRQIYTNFIDSGSKHQIDLSGFDNGVYILTLKNREALLYRSKILKQN